MRSLVIAGLLVACKREPKPEPTPPAVASASGASDGSGSAAGGSYSDLVKETQSGSATETRTELACSKKFVELSKQPRRELPSLGKDRCPQKDFDAQMKCYEKREAELDKLPAAKLWKEAGPSELVFRVVARIEKAAEAGATLTAAERELEAVLMFDGEVRNGGLHQYFFNSSGGETVDARAGLVRFGMTESVAILDCALTAFPDGKASTDRETRNDQLARWGERQFEIFDVLTDAYYVIDDEEWRRAYPYVRDHQAEFPSAK
jgi:hypothetical protein